MQARKREYVKPQATPRAEHPNNCFCTLMAVVPLHVFVRMAMKSGLPALEQRKLCDAFKRLKG